MVSCFRNGNYVDLRINNICKMITNNCLVGCRSDQHHTNCTQNFVSLIKIPEIKELEKEYFDHFQSMDDNKILAKLTLIINKLNLNKRIKHRDLYKRHYFINYCINTLRVNKDRLIKLLDIDRSKLIYSLKTHESLFNCDWYYNECIELINELNQI